MRGYRNVTPQKGRTLTTLEVQAGKGKKIAEEGRISFNVGGPCEREAQEAGGERARRGK